MSNPKPSIPNLDIHDMGHIVY